MIGMAGGANSGRTWSDVGGLNINIDNLSLSGKPRSNAPSMNQLASSGPMSPQPIQGPMLIPNAAAPTASMPFMSAAPPMMMNPRPTMPTNPFGVAPAATAPAAGMSGFVNNPMTVMPNMMLASPNGTGPNMNASPFHHPAFGK